MTESQFCQHNDGIWTTFNFLFKFTYHIFYIKCLSPINSLSNIKNYLETPFSFQHPCSNKQFSWCPPCPWTMLGGGLFGSQTNFWRQVGVFFYFKGGGSPFVGTYQNRLWKGGDSTSKTWIVYLKLVSAVFLKFIIHLI